jgi:hypothetical protein
MQEKVTAMNNRKFICFVFFLSFLLFQSACTFPALRAVGGDSVVIISPQHGARLNAGDIVEVISEVSALSGGSVQHLTVNSQPYRTDEFTAEFVTGSVYQPWIPPGPGEYILQVIVETHGGDKLISEPITVYVDIGEGETPTPTKEGDTPMPTFTPTVTSTATSEYTTGTAEINLNCRVGPGYDYDTIDGLRAGETSPIVGVNDQRTWGLIEGPHDSHQCWVPLEYTIVVGDISVSPVHSAPPLVKKTPTQKPTKKIVPTDTPTKTPGGPTTP